MIKLNPKNLRDTEKEVLNYNNILKKINGEIQKNKINFSLDLILKIHSGVTKDLLLENEVGAIRKRPVFINNPFYGKLFIGHQTMKMSQV